MMNADEKDLEWYKNQTEKDRKLLDRLKKAQEKQENLDELKP